MAYTEVHDARFGAYFPGLSLEYFRQLCTPVDLQSTLSAYGDLNVEVDIRFPSGANFARLRHEFKPTRQVEIHWNFVEAAYRGGGYSRFLMGRALEFYKSFGFREVVLEAARPFGLFVWALHGFDFDLDHERDRTRERILHLMGVWKSPEEQVLQAKSLYHAWHMATFTAETGAGKPLQYARSRDLEQEGYRSETLDLGEYVLLKGRPWRGIMRLDDTDPTWLQHQRFTRQLER